VGIVVDTSLLDERAMVCLRKSNQRQLLVSFRGIRTHTQLMTIFYYNGIRKQTSKIKEIIRR
jgi:hypothetical protein